MHTICLSLLTSCSTRLSKISRTASGGGAGPPAQTGWNCPASLNPLLQVSVTGNRELDTDWNPAFSRIGTGWAALPAGVLLVTLGVLGCGMGASYEEEPVNRWFTGLSRAEESRFPISVIIV